MKNGELTAQTVSAAVVSALKDAGPSLRRQDRKQLFRLLSEIDEPAVAVCLDAYLDLCPVAGEPAESHLGNGAWYCYLAGEYDNYEALTDRALEFSPRADWLLGNRAFALYLSGRPREEVLAAYRQAAAATPDRERWQHVAVKDLEKHSERCSEAEPVPAEFIAEVAAIGTSLPTAASENPDSPAGGLETPTVVRHHGEPDPAQLPSQP